MPLPREVAATCTPDGDNVLGCLQASQSAPVGGCCDRLDVRRRTRLRRRSPPNLLAPSGDAAAACGECSGSCSATFRLDARACWGGGSLLVVDMIMASSCFACFDCRSVSRTPSERRPLGPSPSYFYSLPRIRCRFSLEKGVPY